MITASTSNVPHIRSPLPASESAGRGAVAIAESTAPKWDSSWWAMGGFAVFTLVSQGWIANPLQPDWTPPITGLQYEYLMFYGVDLPVLSTLLICNWVSRLRRHAAPPKGLEKT